MGHCTGVTIQYAVVKINIMDVWSHRTVHHYMQQTISDVEWLIIECISYP